MPLRFLLSLLLASLLAAAPAAAAGQAPTAPAPRVAVGLDVLLGERPELVKGLRVGLVTNASAVDGRGVSAIDRLAGAPGVKLAALFAPEHGLRAELDVEDIPNGVDPATGIPVYSLYGKQRAPSPAQLAGLDALLFDLQDAGARFYTYPATMGLCMAACAQARVPFIVLDRPNPLGGRAEGDVLPEGTRHFTARYPLATRHGLTLGELARFVQATELPDLDLTVVPVAHYRASLDFDATGLPWRKPSPALGSAETALYYVAFGLFEATNVDCRAPGMPFRWFGARWMNAPAVAADLEALHLPGVRFAAQAAAGKPGVRVTITDRAAFPATDAGAAAVYVVARRHPAAFAASKSGLFYMGGGPALYEALHGGRLEPLLTGMAERAAAYRKRIAAFRLYPE